MSYQSQHICNIRSMCFQKCYKSKEYSSQIIYKKVLKELKIRHRNYMQNLNSQIIRELTIPGEIFRKNRKYVIRRKEDSLRKRLMRNSLFHSKRYLCNCYNIQKGIDIVQEQGRHLKEVKSRIFYVIIFKLFLIFVK